MYKVNDRKLRKVSKRFVRYAKMKLPKDALAEFKNNTPRDKGNAKRNTNLKKTSNGFSITGNYNYSGVLDTGGFPNPPKEGTGKTRNGYSTQAPKGMTKPTIDFIEKEVRKNIKKMSR